MQRKGELVAYRQVKDIEKIKGDIDVIKEIQTFTCDRTNFDEKMTILATTCFGGDARVACVALYTKMKLLGSFDIMARRRNEQKNVNLAREKAGLKPYDPKTLDSQVRGFRYNRQT